MSTASPPAAAPADHAEGRKVVARNALHLLLGQVATTALSIVLSAALGRRLGAADFGTYFVVTSTSALAYVFIEWGQGQHVVREIARHPDRSGLLLGSAIAFRAGGALVVGAAATLLGWIVGHDALTLQLSALFIATNLALSISQAFGLAFRGHERMDLEAVVGVLAKALTVALVVPALVLGGRLPSVILLQGAAGALAVGAAYQLSRRIRLPPLQATREMLRDIAVGGAPIVAMSVAVSAQIYIDANVLAQLATPAATGWYAAAKNFMGALVTPASIIVSASYPRLSRAAADPAQFRREVSAAMRPVLTLGALGAAGTYLFADLAVSVVYGKAKFAPAIVILQIFAPSLLLFFVDGLLSNAIIAAGRPKRLATAKLISILIGTALDLLLVPWAQARHGNGGIGIILAFCGSEVAMLCMALWLVPRGALAPTLLLDAGRAVAAGIGSLALVLLLPALSPFVQLPICVASYFALALLFGLLRRSDVELLRSLARRG